MRRYQHISLFNQGISPRDDGLFAALHQSGQTILMVTHSVKAASRAGRVLFLKDGQVVHELHRTGDTDTQFYQRISGALTALTTGGDAQ